MSLQEIALREVVLEQCAFYYRASLRAEDALLQHVDQARRYGCSWIAIADALETSHQNVISRFARKVTKVDLRSQDSPRRAEVRAAHGWKDPGDAT